jgi:hypothetical protein
MTDGVTYTKGDLARCIAEVASLQGEFTLRSGQISTGISTSIASKAHLLF